MKKKDIITVLLAAILTLSVMGQETSTLEETKHNPVRELIQEINLQVRDYISEDRFEEAEVYISAQTTRCEEVQDKELCFAGLSFTKGYLYQQASLKSNSDHHKERAIEFYYDVLKTYPSNQAALSNMAKLYKVKEIDSVIPKLEKLGRQYPKELVNYLVWIGNLYREKNDYSKACYYYQSAYLEDPFSEQACGSIVALYTQYKVDCGMDTQVRGLALHCHEIDLPHYSEELLRTELIRSFSNGEYKRAMESMVLWANVLADNGWTDSGRVEKLYKELLSNQINNQNEAVEIIAALFELQGVLEIKKAQQIEEIFFWKREYPSLDLSGEWKQIEPLQVLLKVLYRNGKRAYFKGNHGDAEELWQQAIVLNEDYDKNYYAIIATDLAKLYYTNSELDPEDRKLGGLIKDIFKMKGRAYRNNDTTMIRRYHTVLGGIFYDQKKWTGIGAGNAKFQLERALSDRLGPIINPELRKMLADINEELDKENVAILKYFQSIKDHLSLDQVADADALYHDIKERYGANMDMLQFRMYDRLGLLINFRKNLGYFYYRLLEESTQVSELLRLVVNIERTIGQNIEKEFVQQQIFKGLTDLASLLPENRKQERRQLYANALHRVSDLNVFTSPNDFVRIRRIKISLEEIVNQPKKLHPIRVNKSGDFYFDQFDSTTWINRETTKVYRIPWMEMEIKIPEQMFELNKVVREHYNSADSDQSIALKVQNGRFIKDGM